MTKEKPWKRSLAQGWAEGELPATESPESTQLHPVLKALEREYMRDRYINKCRRDDLSSLPDILDENVRSKMACDKWQSIGVE